MNATKLSLPGLPVETAPKAATRSYLGGNAGEHLSLNFTSVLEPPLRTAKTFADRKMPFIKERRLRFLKFPRPSIALRAGIDLHSSATRLPNNGDVRQGRKGLRSFYLHTRSKQER